MTRSKSPDQIPNDEVASPQTQLAFRGVSTSQFGTITVRGSKSGLHTGTIEADSDGYGGSFLPSKPFTPGETVTVKRAGIVYVLGGVTRPGGYLMQEDGDLNVTQALALAYGTTMPAAVGSMRLIRKKDDGQVEEIPIPYRAIVKGKVAPLQLQAEDVIYVPISKIKATLDASLVNSGVAAAVIYGR